MPQLVEESQGNPLVVLLAREWPQERSPQEEVEYQYLLKLSELAKGLVSSPYWEVVNVIVLGDLEEAKGALERISTSERDFRVAQGKANGLREAYNLILNLSRYEGKPDGKDDNSS